MEELSELKTEIKQCCICQKWIDKSHQLTIVNYNHYHCSCLDNLWLKITKQHRHKILDKIVQQDLKMILMKDVFDES